MDTIFATLRFASRLLSGGEPMPTAVPGRAPAVARPLLESEAGFTMIEVVISALLVGLIAVGTLSGFDSAGRASTDERSHAQATVLAQHDEERLRALTPAQLGQIGISTHTQATNGICVEKVGATWKYYSGENTAFCEKVTPFSGTTYSGTVFTVTSSARYVAVEKGAEQAALTCETSGRNADYLQTTSSVTWLALGTRPPVTQSSIVTTPVSAALEVKVKNQNGEPVSGATVTVTGAATNATQTTTATGCAIFGGLADKNVEFLTTKPGWVNKQGKGPSPLPVPSTKAVTVSSTTLSEQEDYIAEPGAILATFESNGSSAVGITGDTFYAGQPQIKPAPEEFVGGTVGAFNHTVKLEGLFPFAKPAEPHEPEPYTVYAGDCPKNSPKVVSAGVVKEAKVKPNSEAPVTIDVPEVKVTVRSGVKAGATEGSLVNSTSAKVINFECSAASAQNFVKVPYEHPVTIVTGALVQKYQPYAKELKLCVTTKEGAKWIQNTFTFTNTVKAGTTPPVFYLKNAGTPPKESASELKC
jgi:type II secretory pathway pseudopilin PulG